MDVATEEWRPGSFTKNFSWGDLRDGLQQLYRVIRLGFADERTRVPREIFRKRITRTRRPDYIPINFFLFNIVDGSQSYIEYDELAFRATKFEYDADFDRIALFAFNLSMVGRWIGARRYQARPALWSTRYIQERLAGELNWDVERVSADDIENFIRKDARYRGQTTRKLATNLNHLYRLGRLREYEEDRLRQWWMSAAFLAADRITGSRQVDRLTTQRLLDEFAYMGLADLVGPRGLERELALRDILALYEAVGGLLRFDPGEVEQRTISLTNISQLPSPNDSRPIGAIHPRLSYAPIPLPANTSHLARLAGFSTISHDEMTSFNAEEYVRSELSHILQKISSRSRPAYTSDELLALTRD